MFNSITGTITGKMTASIFIETNGIEWDIMVPSLSLDSFGVVGTTTRVYTWLYHREDQMRLFGFASVQERDIFVDLLKVEGVGPRQAIKILSSITVPDLEAALDGADVSRLEAAPGIGKKTAQKMILTLKGKLTKSDELAGKRNAEKKSAYEDIVLALTDMGFDRKAALSAVEKAALELGIRSGDESDHSEGSVGTTQHDAEQEIFRRAIVSLSS